MAENPELFKKYNESLERLDLEYGLSIMGMAAAIAAYSQCDDWLRALMEQIQKNHQFLKDYFAQNLPGAKSHTVGGYVLCLGGHAGLGIPPQQLSYLIEQEEHMVVENGAVLGKGGAGFIRVNLATSQENLCQGVERFRNF